MLLRLQTLVPTFRIQDPEEQVAARQQLLEGALKEKLDLMSKLVVGDDYGGHAAAQAALLWLLWQRHARPPCDAACCQLWR